MEEKKPRGGPRKYPSKYTWEVTENGLEVIEVRKSQFGDYRKFKSTNKGVSYFATVNTPLFDSIEEANKNRPEVMETKLRQKKKAGGPRKYPSKYGYIVNADNKLELKELRFFEASGERKSGYRVSEFYPSGQIKQGKMYQGQIFDSVNEAENSFKKPKSVNDGFKDPNKNFDAYMLETTDEDIAEWYFEKTGKDWVSDTKTMSQENVNRLKNDFKTDVAQDMIANFDDDLALSAREWLNENTTRGVDPTAQMDDTLKALEQSNADMFPDEVIDTIDNIPDDIVIDTPNAPLKGNQLKQVLKNRLKKLAIGGLNYLDMYELGLIGYAVAEPAAQKLLEPIMPYIIPGYKAPKNNESYKDQVIANLQETAKISPTAKLVENMPEKTEYEKLDNLGYGWLGKMLDR
jgi:hypothetical protein